MPSSTGPSAAASRCCSPSSGSACATRCLPICAATTSSSYHRLLNDRDPDVCRRAAEAWCLWESATPDWPPSDALAERFTDPAYALAFARIVIHYVRHNAWLEDGSLLRGADVLADIPGILVHGRFDFAAPLGNAWALKRAWRRAELVVVDDAGHSAGRRITDELVKATSRLAAR
jgi:proline iminopeptidase